MTQKKTAALKRIKAGTHFKSIALLLSFVLVFVISSCTVRNFIQQQLGIPTTKVHNVAKSGLNSIAACQAFDYAQQKQQTVQTDFVLAFVVIAILAVFTFPFHRLFFDRHGAKRFWESIPLYLLYGKMKLLD